MGESAHLAFWNGPVLVVGSSGVFFIQTVSDQKCSNVSGEAAILCKLVETGGVGGLKLGVEMC